MRDLCEQVLSSRYFNWPVLTKAIATAHSWDPCRVRSHKLETHWILPANNMARFLPEMLDILSLPGHQALFQRFKISSAFQGAVVHDASGYFACQDTRDADGNLESFSKSKSDLRIFTLISQALKLVYLSRNLWIQPVTLYHPAISAPLISGTALGFLWPGLHLKVFSCSASACHYLCNTLY